MVFWGNYRASVLGVWRGSGSVRPTEKPSRLLVYGTNVLPKGGKTFSSAAAREYANLLIAQLISFEPVFNLLVVVAVIAKR